MKTTNQSAISGLDNGEIEIWRDEGMERIRTHTDLDVYKLAMDSAMEIFYLSKEFPSEERYSLTDQVRRSSRSVCANLAEAFRKRKYPKSFISKLSDSEGEAAET